MDWFTAITDVPFAECTSYTPGGTDGDSTTVALSEKRSVIESVRAGVPRRTSVNDTVVSVGEPRLQRSGAPARNTPASGTTGRRSLRPAASQSNRVPKNAPYASARWPPRNLQRQ